MKFRMLRLFLIVLISIIIMAGVGWSGDDIDDDSQIFSKLKLMGPTDCGKITVSGH